MTQIPTFFEFFGGNGGVIRKTRKRTKTILLPAPRLTDKNCPKAQYIYIRTVSS